MRIMLDTNVLLSALLFPGERMNRMMRCIFEEHRLVLSSFVVEELGYVVRRKFPAKAAAVDQMLSTMSYELVYTPQIMDQSLFEIRDPKDYPVLYTAIMEDVDVLITGDKDFSEINVERPEIYRRSLCADTALFKNVLQKSGRCRHSILAFVILLQQKFSHKRTSLPRSSRF